MMQVTSTVDSAVGAILAAYTALPIHDGLTAGQTRFQPVAPTNMRFSWEPESGTISSWRIVEVQVQPTIGDGLVIAVQLETAKLVINRIPLRVYKEGLQSHKIALLYDDPWLTRFK